MHFAGIFFTDPSTINNATENYDLTIKYNNDPPTDTNPNSVWWNKNGQAFFKVPSATVKSAYGQNYQPFNKPTDDVIVGAQITSVPVGGPPTPQYGRLVDLDPDQQARSMIVGLCLKLTIPSEPNVSLTGTIRPMWIIDLWGRVRVPGSSGGGITTAGAMYQSVMEDLQWSGISGTKSALLKQLYQVSPKMLSFKMVVDGYNGTITSDQFGQGRVVGTIGPYFAGEPAHFVAKRRVWPGGQNVPSNSPMNPAPFQIVGTKLVIDLGNSVPTTSLFGTPPNNFTDLGKVSAVIDPAGQKIQIPIYSGADAFAQQYYNSAGIFQVELGSNASSLNNKPLGIQITPPTATANTVKGFPARNLKEGLTLDQTGADPGTTSAGATIALAENQNGMFADVDFNALRMQKGAPAWNNKTSVSGTEITSTVSIPLYLTQWGKPAPNQTVNVQTATNQYQFRNEEGSFYNINNEPMSAIKWPTSVKTNAQGVALLQFTANSLSPAQKPGRRAFVDGQLYFFTHDHSMDLSGQAVSLLVFDDSPYVANPTWWKDIYPIFLQYARLYPAMRSLIDLSDYDSVTNTDFDIPNKIKTVMTLPLAHPGYMPVTRDISPLKLDMIMRWFTTGMPEGTKPTNP
jgi:hypothetical protein